MAGEGFVDLCMRLLFVWIFLDVVSVFSSLPEELELECREFV